MLSHIFRAALQWALFLPLRVTLILLGLLVVPLALPFLTFEGPSIPFTQAPGNWRLARLPAWAWLWSNDRDGALGDKRGWWHLNALFGLGAYHWFSQFWWLAIRNPVNNMRFVKLWQAPVKGSTITYVGDYTVRDHPGEAGWQFVTTENGGKHWYGFYLVHQWSDTRAFVIRLGFKFQPDDAGTDGEPLGMTTKINLYKEI